MISRDPSKKVKAKGTSKGRAITLFMGWMKSNNP